ncbi:IS30 family transposase [Micromonospora tulbaghiae]|uniref:IS30 family transposase n=1 Tax=Micromonospora tulbaghiae TaxID=479978 RepID=A0A386WRY8_9ACTN|nr:IS30 family transposase [Micromonospora tulbaghiae]AYF30733.1 IS30 family transposase [Micromonospora tulbaghiae]AYF31038.1 IS30 family transposase [Micromonospora tulbaghiae]
MFEIRGDRRPQGPKKLRAERQAYLDLVARGVSTSEACRLVGINRKTGHRWRYGRTRQTKAGQQAVPPAARPLAVSDRFLSQAERIVIADRLREGASQAAIAAELRRSPGTISREIRRNRHPDSGDYRPYAAQQRADSRRPRPKIGKIAACPALREHVQAMLDRKHSPEQISRRLRRDFPERNELHVSHETIYQALYVQGRGELRRELTAALRTGRAVRRPRRQPGQRQPRFTHPMVMISERPAEADDRAVPGHWEGDLIIGKDNGSAIGTLVERSTRYVLLVHLGAGRSADRVRDGLLTTMATLPQHLKRSLTWDQGIEMAMHHQFSITAQMPVYFCDPHSPWQRGSNENTNGLLRQYFPKGTDLAVHGPDHLATVAAELNGRPRKTLGWDTPAERLAKLLAVTD